MSTHAPDPDGPGPDAPDPGAPDPGAPDPDGPDGEATDERYAALEVADDAVVIYDQSNHRAWIQSDTAESLERTT